MCSRWSTAAAEWGHTANDNRRPPLAALPRPTCVRSPPALARGNDSDFIQSEAAYAPALVNRPRLARTCRMKAIFIDCNQQLAPIFQHVHRPDDPPIVVNTAPFGSEDLPRLL